MVNNKNENTPKKRELYRKFFCCCCCFCFVYLQNDNDEENGNAQDQPGDQDTPNNDPANDIVILDGDNGNGQDPVNPNGNGNGPNNPNGNIQDQPERPRYDPLPVKLYLSLYKPDISLHKSVFCFSFLFLFYYRCKLLINIKLKQLN